MPEGSFAALDYMFHPRSIAVVGASTQEGPGSFVAAIKEMGFAGPLYPVNPKADEIQGLKCYPRLTEIPGDVDHVISSVPLRFVEQLVEDCAAKHVKVLHFFTAGFSETGDEEATALERRVLARAAELGIRVVGPNCMGLYVPASGLSFMPFLETEPGPVALLSQSGANAGEFCRTGAARGLRYSKVVSYGNGADVRESELLEYIAEDPEYGRRRLLHRRHHGRRALHASLAEGRRGEAGRHPQGRPDRSGHASGELAHGQSRRFARDLRCGGAPGRRDPRRPHGRARRLRRWRSASCARCAGRAPASSAVAAATACWRPTKWRRSGCRCRRSAKRRSAS